MKQSFKITLFSTLTLIAVFISALGVMPAYADQPATEAVTKNGTAGTVPDGGVGSQTIDWTIDYDLTSSEPLTNLTLTDTWSAGQTLVPGSVQTPGGTWSYNQPDSTSIDFTNALVAPGGKGAGIPLSIPLSGPVSFSGGGDGFNPAVTASGKILGINHHTTNAGIWCYDMAAEGVCAGYETKMFPSINTTHDPVTRAIGNKIYIAGVDTALAGVTAPGNIYCWDTDTDSLCGTSPHISDYDRMELSNGLLYVLLATGEVDCYDPANALAQCAGYPVNIGVTANSGSLNGNNLLAAGDKLYALNNTAQLNCLDTGTLGLCAGWSITPIAGPTGADILFPRLDAAGTITGVCASPAGGAATCYDLDGTNPTVVNGVAAVQNGTYSSVNDGTYFGSRVWFAGYGNNLGCWDWATNDVCTGDGFTGGKVTADLGLPYAVTHDAACLYTFGDMGSLHSTDPNTGETPCTVTSGSVTVNIDDFYNAAPGSVSATWSNVLLTDIDLTPGVEFNSLVMTVVNPSDGSIVSGPTEMIGGAGVVDISSVSTAIRELKLQIIAQPVGTTAWADSISPKIWLTFDSDTPIQFSYQTTVTCAGSSQNLTNTINTTLDPHSVQASVSACVYDTVYTLTLKSLADNDGWVRESSETSNKGGTLSSTKEIPAGDDAENRQLRSFLHFDTSSLPEGAVITSVKLRVRSINVIGANPFDTLGNIVVDIREGAFSDDFALQLSDFRDASSLNAAAVIRNTPDANNWYTAKLKSGAYPMILNGDTQYRLRFQTDDNNNSTADYIRFYSGNAVEANQPQLIIEYTLPAP